ncbi:hypothetical protein [Micromonospora sp. CA-248212]|uniref:hypothetical protein n=1 Tax=Micromonospora sp. CA-248212 TaxID=3239961 RepID=UPI003D8F992A
MTTLTIAMEQPLSSVSAEEFGRRIFFATADILNFRFVRNGDEVTAVDLTVADQGDVDQVRRKVNAVLNDDVLSQLTRPPKVIWSSPAERPVPDGTFDRLMADGEASPSGQGQVALGPQMLHLMDALDDTIRDIVVDEFRAREQRYPTLIPASVMHRCGYLTSFPQYLMFVSRLHSDRDVYRDFVTDTSTGGAMVPDVLDRCTGVDYCLPPTMCYHTFHQHADGTLPEDAGVVTARGKSFRHEEKYHSGLERLWDFTIREIVFLGDRDHVTAGRQRLLDRILGLTEDLGLSGRCEVASDPFFGDLDVAARATSQRLLELKYELRLDVGGSRDIAVGSFNLHERTFGSAFGIHMSDGEVAHSACAGFGLERLAYAVVCQHGLDPAGWPARVAELLAAPDGR